MNIIIEMAWKNVFRNKRRSILSGIAIFITAVIICLLLAIENGMILDMKENIKNHTTGDVRVRNMLYSENERITPLQFYVEDTTAVMHEIEKINTSYKKPVIDIITAQTKFPVSIYKNETTYTATGIGIDFTTSQFFTSKNTKMIEGRFPQKNTREIVIAQGISNMMNLQIADKFTAVTKTANGGTNAMTFTVCGIIHIGDSDLNGNTFLLDWELASSFLRMNGNALEILVFGNGSLPETVLTDHILSAVNSFYENQNNNESRLGMNPEVLIWDNVSMMYQIFKLTDVLYMYITVIFFLLACTVVFNTTMMAVLERKKEIGTLASLGMSNAHIVFLFLLESIFIAFIASLSGILLGFTGVQILSAVGFDLAALGGNSIEGFHFSSYIYPNLGVSGYILIFCASIFTACIACMFPARMVLKVQPAEALRTEN